MTEPRQLRSIALIGFMGCGKSSVGRLVAGRLGFEFVDTDVLIEEQARQRIPEIFATRGEAAFRALERVSVAGLEGRERLVIATGGGVGANPELQALLKRHALVVWLWASAESIWRRVRHQNHRPLLQVTDPQSRIRELLAERQPVYRQADVLINAEFRRPGEVADQVIKAFWAATQPPVPPRGA